MDKFIRLENFMKELGLSRRDVVNYWEEHSVIEKNYGIVSDVPQVKPGYYWYEDDSFSTTRDNNKKLKAIVELVENGVIYGDLTVSEIFEINEQELAYDDAEKYIESFSYPCKANEKIVGYRESQLKQVFNNYDAVRKSFILIDKQYRYNFYWSFTDVTDDFAKVVNFRSGWNGDFYKRTPIFVRPIIAKWIC